MTTFEQLAKSL